MSTNTNSPFEDQNSSESHLDLETASHEALLQARADAAKREEETYASARFYAQDTDVSSTLTTLEEEYMLLGDEKPLFSSFAIESASTILPEALIESLASFEDASKKQEQIGAVLNKRFGEQLHAYVREQAHELLTHIDRDGEYILSPIVINGKERLALYAYKRLEEVSQKEVSDDYETAEMLFDEVEQLRDALSHAGLVEPHAIDPENESVESDPNLEVVKQLLWKYKRIPIATTEGLAHKSNLPSWEWRLVDSKEDRADMKRFFKSLDKEKAIDEVALLGLNTLVELTGFSEDKILKFIYKNLSTYPALALQEIESIHFEPNGTHTNGEEKAPLDAQTDEKWLTSGYHVAQHENIGNSAITVHTNQKLYASDLFAGGTLFGGYFAMLSVLETLDHEIGHALQYAMPVSLLYEWDVEARSESINITDYVEHIKESESSSMAGEDFAESFAMYLKKPEEMAKIAPARYRAMRGILRTVDPKYHSVMIDAFRAQGFTIRSK